MTDFKVGDKAVIRTGIGAPWEGAEVTVTETNRCAFGGLFDVRVTRDSDGQTALFNKPELALVKPEPKFKVGDWVKVHGRNDKWDGTVGTIHKMLTRNFGSHGNLYIIHKDDKTVGEAVVLQFFEGQLEATEAPAKPKFPVGTLVTFADPKNDRWQGGKAEVIEGKGWGRFTTKVRIIEGPPLNTMYAGNYGHELNFDPAHLELWEAPEPVNQESRKPEAVDGPAHYGGKDNPYEVIKVAEAWGFNENAYLFNALKYLGRCEHKGSKVEDLKKLVSYVNREIALEEAK